MKKSGTPKPVERLFPFVLRSRILLVGRETLARSKSKLHFVLITQDLSEASRAEILAEFAHYPVVQHYTLAEVEQHFGLRNTKVIGFTKSNLAQSVYSELKEHRLNKPAPSAPVTKPDDASPAAQPGESAPATPPETPGDDIPPG